MALCLLTGCEKHKDETAAAAAALDTKSAVRHMAENVVADTAQDPGSVRFRGVQVWSQAMSDRMAVCGQVAIFGNMSQTYVPFVAVVGREDLDKDVVPHVQPKLYVASTPSEASRAYIATVDRCFDGGGPVPSLRSAPSVPPMPGDIGRVQEEIGAAARSRVGPEVPAVHAPPSPSTPLPTPPSAPLLQVQCVPAPAPSVASAVLLRHPVPQYAGELPATGTAVMRRKGNIRGAPHGGSIRALPKGTIMRVFAELPGGWLEVGDTAPFGWIHSSFVSRR
jgi:hypothetical protein